MEFKLNTKFNLEPDKYDNILGNGFVPLNDANNITFNYNVERRVTFLSDYIINSDLFSQHQQQIEYELKRKIISDMLEYYSSNNRFNIEVEDYPISNCKRIICKLIV